MSTFKILFLVFFSWLSLALSLYFWVVRSRIVWNTIQPREAVFFQFQTDCRTCRYVFFHHSIFHNPPFCIETWWNMGELRFFYRWNKVAKSIFEYYATVLEISHWKGDGGGGGGGGGGRKEEKEGRSVLVTVFDLMGKITHCFSE